MKYLKKISLAKVSVLSVALAASLPSSMIAFSAVANQEAANVTDSSENKTEQLLNENTLLVDDQSAKNELMVKLANVEQFNAQFTQTVIDADGNTLQDSEGQLALFKPNRVRWHTISPEETLIVSDGNTLWFFDPFIEQVTAHTLDNAIANTPVLLLTSNDKALWQQYLVVKATESKFLVSSKDADAQVKQLAMQFDENAQLTSLSITDSTGQVSHIVLTQIKDAQPLAQESFEFIVPDGVYLDDQR